MNEMKDRFDEDLGSIAQSKGIFQQQANEDLVDNDFFSMLVSQIADKIGCAADKLWNVILQDSSSLLETVQKVLGMYFDSVDEAIDNYVYFFAVRNLKIQITKRIEIVRHIREQLYRLDALSKTNVVMRISPTAAREVETILNYLKRARIEINSSFVGNDALMSLATGKDTSQYFRLKNARVYLEKAQSYIIELKDKKNVTRKEKEFLAKLETYIKTNWSILSDLSSKIPFLDISSIPLRAKTLVDNPMDITKLLLNNDATLRGLNVEIDKAVEAVKGFDKSIKSYKDNSNNVFLGKVLRFQNPELDYLIEDIQTREYPRTFLEFVLKAPAWYGRIEIIKNTLFLTKVETFGSPINKLPFAIATLRDKLVSSHANLLYTELLNKFPVLMKTLYIGNIVENKKVQPSIKMLLNYCDKTINEDNQIIGVINSITTSTSYGIFEATIEAGLNALGTLAPFAEGTGQVIDAIKNGSFLSIPIVSTVEGYYKAMESLLNYSKEGFVFDPDNIIGEKNLLPPSTHSEDVTKIGNSVFDSYTELYSTLNNHLDTK